MKRIVLAVAVATLLGFGAGVSARPHHPNIVAAHNLVISAMRRIRAAQRANEFDLAGHAAKAKTLLEQAEVELKLAMEAARER
jgi:hypothetical protein